MGYEHSVINSQEIGAPAGTRTPNPQVRSLVLYPVELRVRKVGAMVKSADVKPLELEF